MIDARLLASPSSGGNAVQFFLLKNCRTSFSSWLRKSPHNSAKKAE
jgi:hypothetical protein